MSMNPVFFTADLKNGKESIIHVLGTDLRSGLQGFTRNIFQYREAVSRDVQPLEESA
jgi:hypothetical protein